MCLGALFACNSVHHMEARLGINSPGNGIIDTCEPPCGCWDLNKGPLQVQQGFFLFWFGFLRLTVLLILYMCASEYVLLVYGFP